MPLLSVVIVLIVFGLIVWAIQTYLPIPQPIKGVIIVLIVLVLCLWLLSLVGVPHVFTLR